MNKDELKTFIINAGHLMTGVSFTGCIGRGAIEGFEVRIFFDQNEKYIGYAVSEDNQHFLIGRASAIDPIEDDRLHSIIPNDFSEQWKNILLSSFNTEILDESNLVYKIISPEEYTKGMNRFFSLEYTKLTRANVNNHVFVWSVEAFMAPAKELVSFFNSEIGSNDTRIKEDGIGIITHFNEDSERIIFYKVKKV